MLRESDARELLPELRFPPLEISFEMISGGSGESVARGGWRARVAWEGLERTFVIEYKRIGTPREVETAVAQLKLWETTAASGSLPMVMTPYLPPETLDRLLASRISGIDFSGNGVVVVPGRCLVYRTGQPNKFPSSAPIKAIFRGTSSLVSRTLLARPTFKNVSALRDGIIDRDGRISLGTVSKVLQSLEEELLVARNGAIRLLSPDAILARLVSAYQAPTIAKRLRVRADLDEDFFARALLDDDDGVPLRVATSGQPLYMAMPASRPRFTVYTSSIDRLLRCVGAEEDSRFGSVELRETSDQRIYFDSRRERGMIWTAPLQVYLELSQGSERDRQAADQLRQSILAVG